MSRVATIAPPERAVDRLLAELEERHLTPREARVLLWLTERDATPDELADALQSDTRATQRAVKRLERRGLVRRTFGASRRRPYSRLGATIAGLRTLRPLVEQVAGTGDSRAYSLWRGRRR